MDTKTDGPQMDQPSPRACGTMAGKLQIYADWVARGGCLACKAVGLARDPITSHQSLPRLPRFTGRLANDQLCLKNGVPAFLNLAIQHFQQELSRTPAFFF